VLTERGRDLLEANRYERPERTYESRQIFYAGLRKPRELTHDTRVYRVYQRTEERLRGEGGRVRRVVLDYELKRLAVFSPRAQPWQEGLRRAARSRTGRDRAVGAGARAAVRRRSRALSRCAHRL
jgi:hypothetical protein